MKMSFGLGYGIRLTITAEQDEGVMDDLLWVLQYGVSKARWAIARRMQPCCGGCGAGSKIGRRVLRMVDIRKRGLPPSNEHWLEALLPILEMARRVRADGAGLAAFESMMRDRARG